mgnify:CR=1 FL=1
MYPTLIETIAKASQLTISEDRKQLLSEFVSYLNQKKQKHTDYKFQQKTLNLKQNITEWTF